MVSALCIWSIMITLSNENFLYSKNAKENLVARNVLLHGLGMHDY